MVPVPGARTAQGAREGANMVAGRASELAAAWAAAVGSALLRRADSVALSVHLAVGQRAIGWPQLPPVWMLPRSEGAYHAQRDTWRGWGRGGDRLRGH